MGRSNYGRGALVVLALAIGLAATGPPFLRGAEPAEAQSHGLGLKRVGAFNQPTHIAHAPRSPRLLYIVEQPGTIRVLRRGNPLPRPFLDLTRRVRQLAGNGMFSVAFHPRYPRNRQFYVLYVNQNGHIQVDRLRSRRGQPARAVARSRRPIIRIAHPGIGNHFGGQLQLGPNGSLLYLSTGDGGHAGEGLGPDPYENAQSQNSLLGKLLRIRPKPTGGHRAPRGNPFVGRSGRNAIFSIGLRNPWRFSIDRRAREIWIGDVGENRWEEINRAPLPEANGANFGWPCFEGAHAYEHEAESPHHDFCESEPPATFTAPVFEYPISGVADCTVIGGHVVRGSAAPEALRGRYLYGDLCTGRIHSLDPRVPADDRDTGLRIPRGGGFGLTTFGEGRRGAVYAAERREGGVFRIVSR